ncbi:exosortase C-terminal domain/associated protein EpsI [Gemmata sp.]|uniref:exosortase C-terminal domain/associated protein EpsI n=1 Tax=Gemmata sp. TaxID=1914242 RepID=UPI003F6E9CD6
MSINRSRPPVAAVVLAAGGVALVCSLARFWGANPEYVDRFLILAGAAYAAWSVWPAVAHLSPAPSRLGYLPLLVGAAAFPVGWFLQAQVVPKPVVLWWLTAVWVLAAGGLVLVAVGPRHLRRLAFPLGFVFFALPVPLRVLVPLQLVLQTGTTTVAAWALPVLGIAVERHGFVLSLPGGDLGVAEACSGVRSVTALTAIAAFVAWWRGFGPVRGAALVLLSVPVIAAVNAARVVASGVIQERAGADYVRGNWHEAFGVLMVLLGLGLIVALAHLLRPRPAALAPAPEPALPHGPPPLVPRPATVVLISSAVATVAAQFLGTGAEQEVLASAPIEQIPHALDRWRGTDLPVPDDVRSVLSADAITRREYSDLGYTVHVWVIYWSSQRMVNGYHHPDVCWPNRGFRQTVRDTVPVPLGGGPGSVPVTLREFVRTAPGGRDTDRQLILYWTQEGRRVWDAADEQRAQATGGAAHEWLGERLFRRERPAVTGRLVVLLGTPLWGDGATIRTQTLGLAGRVAGELYRACPWADPQGGTVQERGQ